MEEVDRQQAVGLPQLLASSLSESSCTLIVVLMEALAYAAQRYGLVFRADDHGAVVKAACSPLALHVDVSDDWWQVAYFCRAAYEWPGDRSDINDLYPSMMQAACWLAGMGSLATVQVPHPAADLPGEIYARYLVPVQPAGSTFRMSEATFPRVARFVSNLHLAVTVLHDLVGCALPQEEDPPRTFSFDDPELKAWAARVSDELFDDPRFAAHDNFVLRTSSGHSWRYYHTSRNGASAFYSPAIAAKAREVMAVEEVTRIPIPGGTLFDSGGLLSYSSSRLESRGARAMRRLEGSTGRRPKFVPLEDFLLVVGQEHLLFLPHSGGAQRFNREKERVRTWHRDEALRLFGPEKFEWLEPLAPDRFEQLTYDLLMRESGVDPRRVRSMGPTTERDGGRDLVVEWRRPAMGIAQPPEEAPMMRVRQFMVQCKASTRNVGIRDVPDILAAMYHHRADGYLLVTSRQISNTLLTRLEDMRRRGDYDAEWWTRAELEHRLRQHPDLLARYSDLVVRATE